MWPAAVDRAHFCGLTGDSDGTQPQGYAYRLAVEVQRRTLGGRSVQQAMSDLSALAACLRSTWLEPAGSKYIGEVRPPVPWANQLFAAAPAADSDQ
jgi:hypothetical protein